MAIKPYKAEKIKIPTDFTEFGGSKEQCTNVAGCENCSSSEKVLEALRNPSASLVLEHWQSQDSTLRGKIADLYSVEKDQVYLTSGAMGAIQYAFEVFVTRETNVGLAKPDFSGFVWYANRGRSRVNWLEAKEFPFDVTAEKIDEFVKDRSIDFLITSNPSAATGRMLAKSEIECLLEKNPETLFVIDEADSIRPDLSSASLAKQYDNALFLGSFSKFYGLSGLRIGYLITPKKYAPCFDGAISPIELTSIAILAATVAIDDLEYQKSTQDRVAANLGMLEAACNNTPYKIVPGSSCFASYIWSPVGEKDPYTMLAEKGIKIAPAATFRLDRGGRINLSESGAIEKVASAIKQDVGRFQSKSV